MNKSSNCYIQTKWFKSDIESKSSVSSVSFADVDITSIQQRALDFVQLLKKQLSYAIFDEFIQHVKQYKENFITEADLIQRVILLITTSVEQNENLLEEFIAIVNTI